MEDVARIVLGLEEHAVAEEVMHFLDRTGRARVVATASDERQLAEAVRQLEPDAVVASPALVDVSQPPNGSVLLAVDTSESVQSLRRALRAGARGFYLWPAERDELAGAAAGALQPSEAVRQLATVIAVWGSRGGSGATFLSTHLAAALTRRERDCVLVDLDLTFGDVAAVCGISAEETPRSIADLAPVAEELSPGRVDEVLWRHPDGFRVLLAPADATAAEQVRPPDVRASVHAVRRSCDVVVLHLTRSIEGATRVALDVADRVVVILQLDVRSFRAAKRAIAATGIEERCVFVVNRAARSEIAPADVERVFGRPPVSVIPVDRSVPVAQDRGHLLPMRGRTGRAVDRLARYLLEASA
jgi:Flp pilus assembly CpaE family ATPase